MCKAFFETKLVLNKLKVENITVTRPPLLKVYYWESLDIDGFNEKMSSELTFVEHDFYFPTTQLNTRALKIVLWLRNWSENPLDIKLKRIKNCDCSPQETRVGFNQFRQLYHCPHRCLIHILQECIHMEPNDLVAMSVVTFSFLYGTHKLTYEIRCSDTRVIVVNFHIDVVGFDPLKCVLTKELLPINLEEYRRFTQPIWLSNITMQHINFLHYSTERGLRMSNHSMAVPRQSVWPLMVEYRPSDVENEIEFQLQINSLSCKYIVKSKGYMGEKIEEPYVPLEDYECADFLYVLYPNKLEFVMEQGEERSLMVHVHNYNKKCVEFFWQSYIIKDMFEVTFEPQRFRLKPHHSALCVVKVVVHGRPMHFQRVPAVLEIHRIFDKPTQVARELLTEVESIDDPKWGIDSYLEHVFLHLNIKANFKKEEEFKLDWEPPKPGEKRKPSNRKDSRTIFEKLFWEYLSNSNFMRENKGKIVNELLTYTEIIEQSGKQTMAHNHLLSLNRCEILRTLSHLLADCLKDIAKNWRFVPLEMYKTN